MRHQHPATGAALVFLQQPLRRLRGECTGLGSKWAFDPAKVVADPARPLFDGGLVAAASSSYVRHLVEKAAAQARIDLKTPYENLTRKALTTLMETVAAAMQEVYDDATDVYKEWLTDYMSAVECPGCHGKRLRPASLAVRVRNFSIAEFTALPVGRALVTARNWEFSERETQIAGRGGG